MRICILMVGYLGGAIMRVRGICISLAAAVFVTGLLFFPGRAVSASEGWDQTIQINPSEIEASSILSEPGFSHSPYNLFNTSKEDCWTEGAPGNGIGENLTFFFTDDVELTSFSILPGFHKSEKLFYENGAPTMMPAPT